VEESCAAERSLHAALMDDPARAVAAEDLARIADADARENYALVLRFRDRLLAAGTVERCYRTLFKTTVDVPPLFIEQMAHVILRNILDGCEEPLRLRAAELFFREQKATIRDGHVLLADLETVEMHASGSQYGSLGRLIVEARGAVASASLDVLDRQNAALYWERESRHDTVVSFTHGRPALEEFCRAVEAWVGHFTGARVDVTPVRRIEEARWAWHIGLDAEATTILNALWAGEEVEAGRMRRILALFRMTFANPAEMRRDIAGRPVVLALAADENDVVRMKPQNLLLNLPLSAAE
jgi:plasmid stability protein